jgi:hypothetical protein
MESAEINKILLRINTTQISGSLMAKERKIALPHATCWLLHFASTAEQIGSILLY